MKKRVRMPKESEQHLLDRVSVGLIADGRANYPVIFAVNYIPANYIVNFAVN